MMRWLLGLLLSGNVVLAAWIFMGPERTATKQPVLDIKPDVGEIFLLDEIPPELPKPAVPDVPLPQKTETQEKLTEQDGGDSPVITEVLPTTSPTKIAQVTDTSADQRSEATKLVEDDASLPLAEALQVSPPPYCGELGPFKKTAHARSYQKQYFQNLDTAVESRIENVISGYWVLIPALPDRERAAAMMNRLQAAGIKDLWLFTKGERKNSISLGLFSRLDAAKAHQLTIQNKGFFPQISPLTKQQKRWWLTYTNAPSALLQKIESEGLPAGVMNTKKICPTSSVAP